jgi:NitT/TauT family transport system permease protein
VLLDQFLWHPLIARADRFKVEQTASGQAPNSFVLRALRRSALLAWASDRAVIPAGEGVDRLISRVLPAPAGEPICLALGSTRADSHPAPVMPDAGVASRGALRQVRRLPLRRVAGYALVGLLLLGCLWGAVGASRLLMPVAPSEWGAIAVSTVAMVLRTTAALVIGVLRTVPEASPSG